MCMKARKILGHLYRRFYNNSDSSTLLQLYLSLVRQYASPVWNPHMQKDIKLLENVEKFAIGMISYQKMGLWISRTFRHGCSSIPRDKLSLCMLYKIVHNLCYFPSHIITPRPNVSQRTDRRLLLHQPFANARTNTFMYSFVPRSVRVWNSLPEQIVTAPMRSFKNSVTQYL